MMTSIAAIAVLGAEMQKVCLNLPALTLPSIFRSTGELLVPGACVNHDEMPINRMKSRESLWV